VETFELFAAEEEEEEKEEGEEEEEEEEEEGEGRGEVAALQRCFFKQNKHKKKSTVHYS
jgi:hypothetical protein